ncbi:hypothetical protein Bpfe_017684 [Biomphalaria pfeifferi]|uniref:Uncharacterized protein n=1 Tax=Biomphalaria pfeifferi TaxID=112525 RepID=A0AAD8BG37_BIOPF|nr:hypothetical protein Bpfe_017684 [Biomphalaria pfeifferi]
MPLEPAQGGAKKFLYTGPVNSKKSESDQWSLGIKPTNQQSPRGLSVDLNNAWSIRNVGLSTRNTSASRTQVDLSKNVQAGLYSRHGGLNGQIGVSNNQVASPGKSSGVQWASSGHNFSQTSQMLTATAAQSSSNSSRRRQHFSPLDDDTNDF